LACSFKKTFPADVNFAALLSGEVLTPQDFSSVEYFQSLMPVQMEVLNQAYNSTPFKFVHANADTPSTAVNADWTTAPVDNRLTIFEALSMGELDSVNVFLHSALPDLIGLAVFPSEQLVTGDVILMLFSTMPGAGLPNNDAGYTLVHEMGHWLGL